MPTKEETEKTATLPPSKKLALAAELTERGHGLAALVLARAAIAEMTIAMVPR